MWSRLKFLSKGLSREEEPQAIVEPLDCKAASDDDDSYFSLDASKLETEMPIEATETEPEICGSIKIPEIETIATSGSSDMSLSSGSTGDTVTTREVKEADDDGTALHRMSSEARGVARGVTRGVRGVRGGSWPRGRGLRAGYSDVTLLTSLPGPRRYGRQYYQQVIEKHLLQRKWSFWFYQMNAKRDWEENLLPITSFDTIEDFWSNFSFILPPSGLQHGCDYAVFKYGIKPMWEDGMNKKGGRWMISLPRKHRPTYLDWMWLETLLCLIGETFEEQSEDICGAVVSVRPRMDRITIWTNDARRAQVNVRIAQKWKERLGIPSSHPLAYEAHQDCLAKLDDPGAARVLYTA